MLDTHTDTNITPRSAWRRGRKALLTGAVFATALAAPTMAAAADALVAPDPAAEQITALDGTIVWVSGKFGNQTLMQRTSAGITRVKGVPKANDYRSIDLGHDAKNRLVLTYMRCSKSACKAITDNLKGERATFKHLTLKRCELTTAPARWGVRTAYGQLCRKTNRQIDETRSGLYVKSASGTIKHLRRPRDAKKFHINQITSVDIRGLNVAAVIGDVYEYAFLQRTNGKSFRSIFAAASEGDSDQSVRGLAVGSGGAMFVLKTSAFPGDPNEAVVFEIRGHCYRSEKLANPPGPEQENGYLATDLAVDGSKLYLLVPGVGIVTHQFVAPGVCKPL